jgi:hypothetical protein
MADISVDPPPIWYSSALHILVVTDEALPHLNPADEVARETPRGLIPGQAMTQIRGLDCRVIEYGLPVPTCLVMIVTRRISTVKLAPPLLHLVKAFVFFEVQACVPPYPIVVCVAHVPKLVCLPLCATMRT